MIQDECIKSVWNACKSNDTKAGVVALMATGRDAEQGLATYTTIKKMADEAQDFAHFSDILKGEAPMSMKLLPHEAATLLNASAPISNPWSGGGGRTWEG